MKRKARTICIIISTIMTICGLFATMSYSEIWEKEKNNLYLALTIIASIVLAAGIILAIILIIDKKRHTIRSDKEVQRYDSIKKNKK